MGNGADALPKPELGEWAIKPGSASSVYTEAYVHVTWQNRVINLK